MAYKNSASSPYPNSTFVPTETSGRNGAGIADNTLSNTGGGISPIIQNPGAPNPSSIPKPDNPCDIFGCLGSFKNNTRYQSGTAGEIASNIAVDIAVLMTYVAGSIAIIFVLVGAFKMLTSEGDSKKFEDGLKSIRYAVIGLVFSVLAYGLIAMVLSVLGAWSK